MRWIKKSLLLLCHMPTWGVTDDLVLIDAGSFYMGQEGIQEDEEPLHSVRLESYEIDRYETSIGDWNFIKEWAINQGYDFSESTDSPWGKPYWYFLSKNETFPMNRVNWYDAIKWCNAKSEYMGRSVVYFTDKEKNSVYRSGEVDVMNSMVNWDSVGYRLPTEEEWEKAARGGLHNKNYPWGNYIDGSKANYRLSGDPFDDGSSPVGYYDSEQNIVEAELSLEGEKIFHSDQANGFGLYDVIGNVSEWCWDWYDKNWYLRKKSYDPSVGPSYSVNSLDDKMKVHRGGGYKDGPGMDEGKPLRIAFRDVEFPELARRSIGFRCVRTFKNEELWLDSEELGAMAQNWFYLEWLGHYYKSSYDWIFHPELGWVYPTGNGSYDNWIYFPQCGWMWTARFAFPHFFNDREQKWYRLLQDKTDTGWFQALSDGSKQRWGRDYSKQ